MLLASITTKEQLAKALGVVFRKHLVYYLHRLPDGQKYRPFQIRKRSGGLRTILAPHHGLKAVQRKLASLLSENYKRRSCVHGFVAERSIITNAGQHVRKRFVLNLDLKDFFGAINFGRVLGILRSPMYGANEEVATYIAKLCCFENALPQGAPTSPVISNMICGKLDAELKRLAREFDCTYTRYCDDITLSCNRGQFPTALAVAQGTGDDHQIQLGERLTSIISANGFEINHGKTRLLSQSDRQDVTGLITNRFPNIPRRYIRSIRAALHAWKKFGLEKATERFLDSYETRTRDKADFESVIAGRVQYIGAVRGFDDEIYRKFRTNYNQLSCNPIPLHASSHEYLLENAIWVIECYYNAEDEKGKKIVTCAQGTAFLLKNIGIVTCAHCLGDVANHIYLPSAPTKKLDVEVVAKNEDVDLAILKLADGEQPTSASFIASTDSNFVQRGDKITVAGYPGFAPGSTLTVKDGQVSSIKTKSGIRCFHISAPISHGNSGGPVLNSRRQVTGVVANRSDNEFGVIPVSALNYIVPKI